MLFKLGLRRFLVCLIAVAVGFLALIPFALPHLTIAKLVSSSGLVLDIAGILQLEVSGAFERLQQEFFDKARWPHGPPSPITRQIIDNPYTPTECCASPIVL